MNNNTNVLWIFSDQHRAHAMSCSGDVNVDTPYLDTLAQNGCRYEHAYSNAPLCSPFRACLLTGKYVNEHRVNSLHVPLVNQTLITETLQDMGYRTSYYGKWHISGGAAPSHFVSKYFAKGFDEFVGWENSNRFFNTQYFKDTDDNPQMFREMDGYQTDVLTDLAIEGLEKNRVQDKPWFQIVSFEAPHPPSVSSTPDIEKYVSACAPERYLKEYREKEIVFRDNVDVTGEEKKLLEKKLQAYYAAIKNLDDNIGRIYQYLEETDQLDNTIIFYFSDHGDLLGSHSAYGKSRAEEESSNIPLIIHWPEKIEKNQVKEELITGVDFAPTIFGLLDLPVPIYLSGMNLAHQMLGEKGVDRKEALIQYDRLFYISDPVKERFRSIISEQWKYIFYEKDRKVVLFNLKEDPFELRNLAEVEGWSDKVQEMHNKLRQNLIAIDDNFIRCMDKGDKGEY